MRIHIFVDTENISNALFEKSFAYLTHRYEVVKVDIVGKFEVFPSKYEPYKDDSRFRFINCFYSKNSADTFLTAYIIEALYKESLTEGFVLLTQDRDLAVAVKFITDYQKQVILVTEKGKQIPNLEEIGVDMSLVTQQEFEIKTNKRWVIPYYSIPKAQKKYFTYIPRTIFLRTGKYHLVKVHFYNGIEYNLFLNIIPVRKIRQGHSKNTRFKDILKQSFLYVENDRVYIDVDRILEEETV